VLELDALHSEIRRCTRCFDCGFPIVPPPIADGSGPAPFLVVGQAPSISDHRNGAMYTGPAGKRLLGWLKDAGFCDADFGTQVYLTAITKCFPGRLAGKSTDRAPSATERSNCRPWLDAQIKAVKPQVIILFGKMAIDAFLPGSLLDQIVGREIILDDVVYIPLPHSSGASTWLNAPSRQDLLKTAIGVLKSRRAAILAES